MKNIGLVILGLVLGLATLRDNTRLLTARIFRPLRVWWRILRLRRRGLKTEVHRSHGKVMLHVYNVGLHDVEVF